MLLRREFFCSHNILVERAREKKRYMTSNWRLEYLVCVCPVLIFLLYIDILTKLYSTPDL
jgi:hypothetical protein